MLKKSLRVWGHQMCKDSRLVCCRAAAVVSNSLELPKCAQHHQANVEEQVVTHGEEQACTVINDKGQTDRQNEDEQEERVVQSVRSSFMTTGTRREKRGR